MNPTPSSGQSPSNPSYASPTGNVYAQPQQYHAQPVNSSIPGMGQVSPQVVVQQQPAYPPQPTYYPQQQYDSGSSMNPIEVQSYPVYQSQPVHQSEPIYYPGPSNMNPVNQPVIVTYEMKTMFEYAHAASIYAVIELVCYCITIIGLFFIYMPICGINMSKRFSYDDFNCYYIWRVVSLVCSIFLSVSNLSDPSLLLYTLVSLGISIWSFYVTSKAFNLYKELQSQYTPAQLADAYIREGSPCRCF